MIVLMASAVSCQFQSHEILGYKDRRAGDGAATTLTVAAKSAPVQSFFFPLQIGNTWEYTGSFSVDGDVISTRQDKLELVGHEELFGRTYVLQKSVIRETDLTGTDEFIWWTRYRQDRAGLYEADVPLTDPPASPGDAVTSQRVVDKKKGTSFRERMMKRVDWQGKSPAYRAALTRNLDLHQMIRHAAASMGVEPTPPGGVMSDELTRLAYPLHMGQYWAIRDVPLFSSTVEGREMLDLPAGKRVGVRIRIDSDLFGPNDEAWIWFSREGQLKLFARLESQLADGSGSVVTLEIEELEKLDLAR